jgi:hypothetical protein
VVADRLQHPIAHVNHAGAGEEPEEPERLFTDVVQPVRDVGGDERDVRRVQAETLLPDTGLRRTFEDEDDLALCLIDRPTSRRAR